MKKFALLLLLSISATCFGMFTQWRLNRLIKKHKKECMTTVWNKTNGEIEWRTLDNYTCRNIRQEIATLQKALQEAYSKDQ